MASAYPNGDLVRVTAEGSDVVGDPLKAEALVAQTQVGAAVLLQLLASQEAVRGHAVVDGNVNHVGAQARRPRDDVRAIVPRELSTAELKASAELILLLVSCQARDDEEDVRSRR